MYWNEFDPLRRKAPVKLVRSYFVLIIMTFARIRAFSTTSRRCIFPQMSRRCIFPQKNVNEKLNAIYWYRKGKDKKTKNELKTEFSWTLIKCFHSFCHALLSSFHVESKNLHARIFSNDREAFQIRLRQYYAVNFVSLKINIYTL